MEEIDINLPMGAIFSPDRYYRYALWRRWSQVKPLLLFIGLNPSVASSTVNDPTIIRMMVRASTDGFGGLLVSNLYSLVSSDPDVLLKREDSAIGPDTDSYMRKMIDMAGRVICGWGSFPAAKRRYPDVLKIIPEPYCLGINKDGQPKHPLYIGYNTQMVKYFP